MTERQAPNASVRLLRLFATTACFWIAIASPPCATAATGAPRPGELVAVGVGSAPAPGAREARVRSARSARQERSARFTPPAPQMEPVLGMGAMRRLVAEGRSALWVVFTDKGIRDERAFAAAVRQAGERMTPHARDRRAREQDGVFSADFDDVPVRSGYVQSVAATGARVRHVSKWLNAVSVMADMTEARRISGLPFVRAILPLRLSRRVAPVSVGPSIVPAGPAGGTELAPRLPGKDARAGALQKPTNYGASTLQLNGIQVIAVHDSGYSGAGVILAMFDTGYNKSHSATIQLKRIAERDFVWHDGETANQAGDAVSQWDHGTGTWGTAGGYWVGNLIGPAYNATFALAKTEYVPSETPVEEDNWVAAAEWSDSLGVDVISSS